MKHQIKRYLRDFIAILGLVLIAALIGGFILSKERFYLPGWVPIFGQDFYTVKAEFDTAQSLAPGQGQTVNIAGVKVGEISNVELVDGRAVVTLKIQPKYAPIYHNATMLLRPKTGLNDMLVQLDPGTKGAGAIKQGQTLPLQQTKPNVNLDQILAELDSDTRDYLNLLLTAGGEGLRGQGRTLSAALRRFEPTSRDLLAITQQLAQRRENLRHVVHNLQLLSTELGGRGTQIAQFVKSSNAVFATLAQQEADIRSALRLLPGTLKQTDSTLVKVDKLAQKLKPTATKLRPGAQSLASSLKATQSFLKSSTPVIRDQIRPFTRAALPTTELLVPTANDLAALTPDLVDALKVVNFTLNALAYNPSGSTDEGYLFWFSWANHTAASIFSFSDAHGPLRRGLLETSCGSLGVLKNAAASNQLLNVIISLVNVPTQEQAGC